MEVGMLEHLKGQILDKWDNVSDGIRIKVREKAIENTKQLILIHQKK